MHIPDGFFDAPVSLAGGAAAVAAVSFAARKASADLDEREIPLAGLSGAYVFALQMLNFPVAGGTSGHLLGGCLAAVLVGPWMAVLVMTVVLGVQALVFADGGLSALGLNVVVMGVVPALVGGALVRALQAVLPRTERAFVGATAFSAWATVVFASVVFTACYAVGGTADVATGTVLSAMVGVHALIGIGEGVLTAFTLAAVLAARPDLVYGYRTVPTPAAAVAA